MGFIDAIKAIFGLSEPDKDTVEANDYATAIVKELNRMGKCYKKDTKQGPIFQQVQFKPPLKVLPDRIELEVDLPSLPYGVSHPELRETKIIEGLSGVLKRSVTAKYNRRSGFWFVVRREDASKANFYFSDLRPPKSYDPDKTPLLIPIGRDDNGDQPWRDLEKIYHLLIGGATGKGKTRILHSIICWLILHTKPSHVQIILVDLKEGLDFYRYNGVPHLAKPVAIEPEAAHEYLMWVNAEISRRGELFREVRAENIETYRKRTGNFLNNIIFVFDEIANIDKLGLLGFPEKEAEAWFLLRDGAQRARALGIHFIISTQRPSVKIIDGDTKMNFTARIALGTATDADSRVILDNNMATGLDVGDLIYQDGGTRGVGLRGCYIGTDEVDGIVDDVVKNHQLDTRRAGREAELAAQKREDLVQRMLTYAIAENEGRFSIETLFEKFGTEITQEELKDVGKGLEEKGILTPARGRKPRMVVGFPLSVEDQSSDAAPVATMGGNGRME